MKSMSLSNDSITLLDCQPETDRFLEEVIEGLSQPQKRLPCKYFYDETGCELFDRICKLDEYYLTRTELDIMDRCAAEMGETIGSDCLLIELGIGSGTKTRILLDNLEPPLTFVPVDIAKESLVENATVLSRRYTEFDIQPICADFSQPFDLPDFETKHDRRVVYFPGSTVGNFTRQDASRLLSRMARMCGDNGGLLIGLDLQKDRATLEAAYNDDQGVTAAFNLNLLARINEELNADFQLGQFEHRAEYNSEEHRIEIFLDSVCEQQVSVDGQRFAFAKGEAICTEHSHKYDLEDFEKLVAPLGFKLRSTWTDANEYFAVVFFEITEVKTRR